jgi:hypothetical protein
MLPPGDKTGELRCARNRSTIDRRGFIAGMAAGLTSGRALAQPTPADLREAARDAWLFALPPIEVAALRARPLRTTGAPAPINRFMHSRALAAPAARAVTTPNVDTLYSSAFVDTTKGPVRLHVPDCGPRYLSVQIMDMYTTNDFILSPRRRGGAAGDWRLIAPNREAQGSRGLRLSTPHAWLLVRILVEGPSDLAAVHAIQDRLELEGPVFPAPVSEAERGSDWPTYFAAAARLVESDPPQFKNGLDALQRLRDAGRDRDFTRGDYTPEAAAAIDTGVAEAAAIASSAGQSGRGFVGGWRYPRADLGEFGENFVFRAIVAVVGLGALNPSEAMYMQAAGDGDGLFKGEGPYRLSLPGPVPVDAFWSLTMYQPTGDGRFFLVENPLDRYAIGDRTKGLAWRAGGAVDIWIGRSDPGGERTANWLPAPTTGPFALMFRAYLPRPELVSGAYRLPAIAAA